MQQNSNKLSLYLIEMMKHTYHCSTENSKTKSKMNWQKSNDQIIWMIWSESSYKSTTNSEKDNKKREKKILEKINKNRTKTRKKIINSQWIKNTSIIERQISLRTIVKRKNYVFTVRKKNIKLKNTEFYNKKN